MESAKENEFRRELESKGRGEIIAAALELYAENMKLQVKLSEFQRASTEMAAQFQQMKDELNGRTRELQTALEQNRRLSEAGILRSRDLFGRSSEKTADILNRVLGDGPKSPVIDGNPLDEDVPCEEAEADGNTDNLGKGRINTKGTAKAVDVADRKNGGQGKGGKKQNKRKGKKADDLSGLPHTDFYDFDFDKYDRLYGKGNWRIAFWESHDTVEVVRAATYVRTIHTPVLSIGLEHTMAAIPYESPLLQKSVVTPSLMALIYEERLQMFLPFYRQVKNPGRLGLPLSRQVLTGWFIRFSMEYFLPVFEHLCGFVSHSRYQQCDESTWIVIRDGRKAGSKSFIWAHRTSELADGPQAVVYCYEKGRGADHLRRFYEGISEEFYLTCDAYSAYSALAGTPGILATICGCFMHVRRRFVDALAVLDVSKMDKDARASLPEVRAIDLLRELYIADEPLKVLTAEERKEKREEVVAGKVDAFFDFVNGLDTEDPAMTGKMKDAVMYARNQEASLRVFLTDGHIPIDDGATERSIRPIAQARRNSLFSTSMQGARATFIAASLGESAQMNGADPYYYYKYILEEMPKHRLDEDDSYLDDMLPWSEKCLAYEKSEKQRIVNQFAPPGNEKPRTPRKTDRQEKAG